MKYLHYWFKLSLSLFSLAFVLASCTEDFERTNTNTSQVSNEQLLPDAALIAEPFRQMQLSIYGVTADDVQLQENLNSDLYSGYMSIPSVFLSDQNNNNYALVDNWNKKISENASNRSLLPAYNVQRLIDADKKKYGLFEAWSKILKVEAMHKVSDKFGPIVYSKFAMPEADGSFKYDSQEEAYDLFFLQLSEAIDTLQNTPESRRLFSSDLVYGGNYKLWARFANSLRLRLAMRISFVDPAKAKLEAEKSLRHPAGLIVENSQNFIINFGAIIHPLNKITSSWNDTRMNAAMEVYLEGFKDPRISKYFQPTAASLNLTPPAPVYKGIRQGIPLPDKSAYQDKSSRIAEQPSRAQLMTAAEVYFLMAEAKLRGWNLGVYDASIEELYNKGIERSFGQYDLSLGNYISESNLAPIDFVDAVDTANHYKFTNKIPVKLDTADKQKQFRQIITQKWLAMFPDGDEAWAEQRRTGYPILMPLQDKWKKGIGQSVPTGEYIKRLTFPNIERTNNPKGYAGITDFGAGGDNVNTRLWWDVENKTIP